jgi:hypothetical protein
MAVNLGLKRRIKVIRRIGKVILSLVLFIVGLALFNDYVYAGNVTTSVSDQSVQLGETVEVELNIEGDLEDDPVFPDITGVRIQSAGKSSSISIVNGDMSRTVVFKYVFSFERSGEFTVPSIQLEIDGKPELTTAFKVNVSKVKTLSDTQIQNEKPLFFIKRSVSNETPYVGEPVVESLKIYRRMDWSGAGRFGQDSVDLKYYDTKGTKESREEINNTLYGVTTIIRVFVPQKTGEIELGTFGVEIQYQEPTKRRRSRDPFDLFRQQSLSRKRILAPGLTIGVNGVPLKGRPKDYSGFVGKINLSADISNRDVKTGDTVTLTLKASGSGWISSLGLSEVSIDSDKFKNYPDKPQSDENASELGISGYKQLKYALVPVKEGVHDLGSYRFTYFDPSSMKFVTKNIGLGEINVTKGEIANALTTNRNTSILTPISKKTISNIGDDIFDIKRNIGSNNFNFLAYLFSSIGGLFLIFVFASELKFLFTLKKTKKETRVNYLSLISATKKAVNKNSADNLMEAFQEFVGLELSIQPSSVTYLDIVNYFEGFGVKRGSEVFDLLKMHENHKYGGPAARIDFSKNNAVSFLKEISFANGGVK